jgi:hypothetical protein
MKLLGTISVNFDVTDQLLIMKNGVLRDVTPYSQKTPFFIVTAMKTSNLTTTDQIFCILQILGGKWEYRPPSGPRLKERLRFSEEGSVLQYFHIYLGAHELSPAD